MLKTKDNWDGKYYKNNSNQQFKGAIKILNSLNWQGNENVLDVGCGDGKITAEIANKFTKGYVLGVDVSDNMLNEAKKDFGHIKNLEFIKSDITKFKTGKKFDLMISFATFHWIEDKYQALKNVYNVLKDGGKICLAIGSCDKNPSSLNSIYEEEKWKKLLSGKKQTYFPANLEEIKDILQKIGFSKIDIQKKKKEREFKSKQELFNWAFAWVPYSTGLDVEKSKEFTRDIVDFASDSNKDGKLILLAKHLFINAEK